MTAEIWSIAVGIDGISLCAIETGGVCRRRQFYAPLHAKRWRNLSIIDRGDVARILADGLSALFEGDECEVMAMALVTPHRQTCLLTDDHGDPQTPILIDMPLPIARRDVAAAYADDELLALAYRASIVRRLRNLSPDDCLKPPPGIGTLGSHVAQWLTGHACDASEPLGVPDLYWKSPECRTGAFVEAMGIDWSASYRSVRSQCPFARISPFAAERIYRDCAINPLSPIDASWQIDRRIEKLAGIPVYAMGSIDAARAFASCADPIRWSVKVGYDLRAHWIAKRFACAEYEITIDDESKLDENSSRHSDKRGDNGDLSDGFANGDENSSRHFEKQDDDGDNRGNGEYSSQEQSPKPRNYEDWTRAWDNLFALDILPSLKPTDTAYGVSCAHIQSILPESARERAAQNGGIYPFEDLRHAPVGASGLHVISTKNGATVVGLRPGHGDAHWMRASFESMIYDLRAKRSQIRELWGAPISLILEPPWDAACAQWVADILAAPVRYIPSSEPEIAAIGAALSLMRHLELPAPQTAVSAEIVEPSPRSRVYEAHFDIHCALCDALT